MKRDGRKHVGRKQKVVRDLGRPPTILLARTTVDVFGKHEDNVLLVHHLVEILHREGVYASRKLDWRGTRHCLPLLNLSIMHDEQTQNQEDIQ